MLHNVSYLLIFILSCFPSFAQISSKDQRKEILSLINKEIEVVKRSVHYAEDAEQTKLVRRLFNLYSEKMKIIRMEENEDFLESDGEKPEKYFERSREMYQASFREAMDILKDNPNFQDKGQFYYILALNDRDFFDGKNEIKFYYKALSNTKDKKLIAEIKASLADSYYNKKKFNDAIKYYQGLVKDDSQQWWTKYAYNLAWCYLKKKKFHQARELMMKVAIRSLDKKYINFRKQALSDLALFFAYSRQKEKGIAWFKKNVENPGTYIAKMANFYAGRSDYTKAQNLLLRSLKTARGKERIDIQFKLLDIYEKSQQWNKHFSMIKELEANELVTKDEIFLGQLVDGLKISSNHFQEEIKLKGKRALFYTRSVQLIDMVLKHVPEERFETYYILANMDVYFAEYQKGVNNFLEALKIENKKSENLGITKNNVYQKLLSVLDDGCDVLKECNKQKETIYLKYITEEAKGPYFKDVYTALIQLYIDDKRMDDAQKRIFEFANTFPEPENRATLVNFVNQILDYYTEKDDVDSLEKWGGHVKILGLDKDINTKGLRTVVSDLKFKSAIDTAKSEGNSEVSLEKFIKLFNAAGTTIDVKKDAVFNAAVIALGMGSVFKSLEYSQKAMKLMTPNEVRGKSSNFIIVLDTLLKNGHFDKATTLVNELTSRLCKGSGQFNLDTYMNIAYFQKNADYVFSAVEKYSNCYNQSKKRQFYRSLLNDIAFYEGIKGLAPYEETFQRLTLMRPYADKVMEIYFNRKSNPKTKSLAMRMVDIASKGYRHQWRANKTSQSTINRTDAFSERKISGYIIDGKFEENRFQQSFFGVMERLQSLDSQVKSVAREVDLPERGRLLKSLIKAYEHFINEIETIQIPGMPQEYVDAVLEEVNGVKVQVVGEKNKLVDDFNALSQKAGKSKSVKTALPNLLKEMPVIIEGI